MTKEGGINRRYALIAGISLAALHGLGIQTAEAKDRKKATALNFSDFPPRPEGVPLPIATWIKRYLMGYRSGGTQHRGYIPTLSNLKSEPEKLKEALQALIRVPVPPSNLTADAEIHWLYGNYNERGINFEQGEKGERPWPTMPLLLSGVVPQSADSGEGRTISVPYSAFFVRTSHGKRTCIPTLAKLHKSRNGDDEGRTDEFHEAVSKGRFSMMVDAIHSGRNENAPEHTLTTQRSIELHGSWVSIPFLHPIRDNQGDVIDRSTAFTGGALVDFSNNAALYRHVKDAVERQFKDNKLKDALLASLRYSNLLLVMGENFQWDPIVDASRFDGILGAPAFQSVRPEDTREPQPEVIGQAMVPVQLTEGSHPLWGILITKPEVLRSAAETAE